MKVVACIALRDPLSPLLSESSKLRLSAKFNDVVVDRHKRS